MAAAGFESKFTGSLLHCRYVTEGSFRASHRAEQSPVGEPRWASTLPGLPSFFESILPTSRAQDVRAQDHCQHNGCSSIMPAVSTCYICLQGFDLPRWYALHHGLNTAGMALGLCQM